MKALILNFRSFDGKKENTMGKTFVTFDMFDVEKKVFYNVFQELGTMILPDGELPNKDAVKHSFPRIATLAPRVEQYAGQNGSPTFRFYVDKIVNWKFADLSKLGYRINTHGS